METYSKHEIRPHQGAGPAPIALPREPLPMPVDAADSRDVPGYVLRMRRIREREANRAVEEVPVLVRGAIDTRTEMPSAPVPVRVVGTVEIHEDHGPGPKAKKEKASVAGRRKVPPGDG